VFIRAALTRRNRRGDRRDRDRRACNASAARPVRDIPTPDNRHIYVINLGALAPPPRLLARGDRHRGGVLPRREGGAGGADGRVALRVVIRVALRTEYRGGGGRRGDRSHTAGTPANAGAPLRPFGLSHDARGGAGRPRAAAPAAARHLRRVLLHREYAGKYLS